MSDEPLFRNKYRISSTRLKGWNYASAGYYFVTICTKNRTAWFGAITNGIFQASTIGRITDQFWREIPAHFPNTNLDEYVIMPDHVHGIIVIQQGYPDFASHQATMSAASIAPKAGSLSTLIRSYKSAVTRWCGEHGWGDFAWQARFYERILRDEASLLAARRYIVDNPLRWELDQGKTEW